MLFSIIKTLFTKQTVCPSETRRWNFLRDIPCLRWILNVPGRKLLKQEDIKNGYLGHWYSKMCGIHHKPVYYKWKLLMWFLITSRICCYRMNDRFRLWYTRALLYGRRGFIYMFMFAQHQPRSWTGNKWLGNQQERCSLAGRCINLFLFFLFTLTCSSARYH